MGPKIVILGSLRYGNYKVTYPRKISGKWNTEEGYQIAFKKFKPAIDEADLIIVYGIPGEHTDRDVEYAKKLNKRIIYEWVGR